jgi:hypothetical protein
MFASPTLMEHAARGLIGFGAFAAAVVLAQLPGTTSLIGSVVLALGGLVALRGCPMCWTVGLIETIQKRHMFNTRP